jgi:hypothetical protein
MELRIWVPESISAWRYCLRHPRSFLVGAYGFTRWRETHQQMLAARADVVRRDAKIAQLTDRLAQVSKELSTLKRSGK